MANNFQPSSNHHFNYRNAVRASSAMPPVSTRSMPPPPNEPPPPNSKFLSKYRPGYNMTAAPNAVAGGPPVIPSGANYYNPALDFSSPNGFDAKHAPNNVPIKPLQPPPNPTGILKANAKDGNASNPPFKVEASAAVKNDSKPEAAKPPENDLVVLPKLQIPQSEDPPAKPIQLWSKNQIAVEYDSDSETAAAPTTNRLMGKHEWKGPMAKKTKSEKPKKKYSSSSKSASKINSVGNTKGANDLKGIVSYYESEESDSSESGIIFPKGCKPEPSLKSRESTSSKSNREANVVASNQDDTAVSFTMKSQTNSVPKHAVFNEQEDEVPKRPLPKVKLPPPKLSPVAKSPPKPNTESGNATEVQNNPTSGNEKDQSEESKSGRKGPENSDDAEKQKSRSRSKKRSKKRSRSRSRSESRSASSSSDSSRSSYSRSRSYSSDSYSRRGSSSSSYSSYSSRSRSRSSSYRKSRRRRRSSSRRHRRRSDSYSDSNSRRYFPSRSQQGGKKKRRKRNKNRRITRAPNPPFQQRNKSQMPPQVVAPQKLAHNNVGKMNNPTHRNNLNQNSNPNIVQHGSGQVSELNASGAKNMGSANPAATPTEECERGPDQQIIGPQLPKPSGIDEFIAHTSKLGVTVDEEGISLGAKNSNDAQQANDERDSPFVPPSNIPNYSEEEKQKYSDLMNRLNSHIQQREQTSSVDMNGTDGSTNVIATQNVAGEVSEDTSPQQQALQASPSLQVVQQHQTQQFHHHQFVQPQTPQYLYVPTSQFQLFPSSTPTPNLFLPQQPTLLNPLLAQSLGSLGGQLPLMSLNMNTLPLAAGIPTLGHHSLFGGGLNATQLLNSQLINPGLAAMNSQQQLAALYAQILNQNSNSNS